MKVLIVRNADATTNANVRRVASALLSDGHTPIILSRNRNCQEDEPVYIKKNIEVEGVSVDNYELQLKGKTEKGIKNFSTLYSYIKIITKWMTANSSKFDVIHAFDLDSGLAAKKVSKKKNKKLVYHIADFYVDSRAKIPSFLKNIIKNMEFGIINYADDTIICTEERKEQIRGSKPKRLTVVHNSPTVEKETIEKIKLYRDEKPSSLGKVKICYIGMLSKRRFIDSVLRTAAQFDDVELILAGTGDLADMCSEYSDKYENIKFLGKVDYEKTFEIYRESNLMFAIYNPEINNHKYSAANKIYEAMLLKKPIVVAKNTSMDKIVDKYDIGFSIDFSEEEFKNLIDKLRHNLNILDEKSENMDGVYEEYSWEKMKERIVKIYSMLGDEK